MNVYIYNIGIYIILIQRTIDIAGIILVIVIVVIIIVIVIATSHNTTALPC